MGTWFVQVKFESIFLSCLKTKTSTTFIFQNALLFIVLSGASEGLRFSISRVFPLSLPAATVLPTLRGICSIFLLPSFLQVRHEVYTLLQALNSLLKVLKNTVWL